MEKLHYDIPSPVSPHRRDPVLVGVTASGNCEILIEATDREALCRFSVNTSALGFSAIWQAVLTDFGLRHAAGGLAIEINDVGATPAVVSLRLDQAIEEWEAQHA